MALADEVVKVLGDAFAARVRFTLTLSKTVEVSPARIGAVADKIKSGKIDVRVNPDMSFFAGYSSGADYDAATKSGRHLSLKFDTIEGTEKKAAVYHECVHALVDLNAHGMGNADDEVVAYLAEAAYIRAGGLKLIPGDADGAAIYGAAFDVVEAKNLMQKPGQKLKAADVAALRKAIVDHPSYADE